MRDRIAFSVVPLLPLCGPPRISPLPLLRSVDTVSHNPLSVVPLLWLEAFDFAFLRAKHLALPVEDSPFYYHQTRRPDHAGDPAGSKKFYALSCSDVSLHLTADLQAPDLDLRLHLRAFADD
jgi:hypothetical protein